MPRPSRPSQATISAWQNRRFGMFIHWGLYSLLGGVWQGREISGYNEQIQAHARIPKAEYEQLANDFNPVNWDPDAVVTLAKAAGMKFIVLTAKHHDGFSLFETAQSPFNVVSMTPYGEDIVAGLAKACAERGLSFGVYFSTIDWHFDGATGIDYEEGAGIRNNNQIPPAHADLNAKQLSELLTKYGTISEVWFDMGQPTPEQSQLFTDTVHGHQPETMVSGRVFNYQGDFTVMGDNEIPPYPLEEPWQSPASIYHETWGYRSWQVRDDLKGKTSEHIRNLVRVVARGGNYLLNIGPRGDGSIVEFEADVLVGIGNWLRENRIAIEGTSSQPFRKLSFGHATASNSHLYLFILDWPTNGMLELPGLETPILSAQFLDGEAVTVLPNLPGVNVGVNVRNNAIAVIEVVLESPPVIRQPATPPNADGSITLLPSEADPFFHWNGRGYYDPPKLYKLRWWVDLIPDHEFEISATFAPTESATWCEIQFGAKSVVVSVPAEGVSNLVLGILEGGEEFQSEIAITPPVPFDTTDHLQADCIEIQLNSKVGLES